MKARARPGSSVPGDERSVQGWFAEGDEDRDDQTLLQDRTGAEPGTAREGFSAIGSSSAGTAGTRAHGTAADDSGVTNDDTGAISAPDYCEPIIGWRAWRAVENRGDVYLMSVFHRVRWPRLQALRGQCEAWHLPWPRRQTRHAPPTTNCVCGIYASSLAIACEYAPALPWVRDGCAVVGTVALWGDVIEHVDGWRASFAYPVRLHVLFSNAKRGSHATRIASALEHYGVPVEPIRAETRREAVTLLAS
jgi:hypothetical protein